MVHDLNRQGIEKLVGKYDDVLTCVRRSQLERVEHRGPACRDVLRQLLLQTLTEMRRLLDQRVPERTRKFGKLLRTPIQNVARKKSATRAELDQINSLRRIQHAPHLLKLASQQSPKNGMNITRSVKIARLAEVLTGLRIVTKLGLVQTELHVSRERNRPVAANLICDAFAKRRSNSVTLAGA